MTTGTWSLGLLKFAPVLCAGGARSVVGLAAGLTGSSENLDISGTIQFYDHDKSIKLYSTVYQR